MELSPHVRDAIERHLWRSEGGIKFWGAAVVSLGLPKA
jgi:hypothetical protein